ncbi:MAG: cbb3-type cytochrome c oxidase subunit I [Bacteroidota bacterium]|nr:cbb3-type cytochrome c oxidase subunit I [Bacteroidota bacterium]MDP4215046.1 cbb3-type cytochrome c oxidase subunit I [Bacteroidota bacterium]MDP4244277.1 cbb3-type cytochrome c oxidase subunit I [Bacteroidota bacterium]MDP4252793.1 cbb3-type cytochrome c oxidase subunit I [Bacteroidota bacterium]MDP4257522.1 cbb3-type cytochrome c oxidase subunit I [Bacteroidota bacterium]
MIFLFHLPMEKESFLTRYVFSTDHKVIAKQFLITGMAWAVLGGFFSILMRLQLGYPNSSFAVLQKFGGFLFVGGKIQPEMYYQLMTMHGTIMIFFVLTAGLSGTFANFLIPLQVGARDMASPFVNMLSYWAFFIASVIMCISFFVHGGPSGVGWTAYAPLSALRDAGSGSGAGLDLWLLSLSFFIISTLMGGINYISTVLNMRTRGMAMNRLPLSTWGLLFTAIMGLLSFPVLLAAFILLEFDRTAGTSFFLSDIFMTSAGRALPHEGGSALLYQHLFWFLGHPEVYIVIFPAFGMVSEIISVNARKPIFGYTAMVYSMFAILTLSFTVWAHHMFVSGLNPILGSIFVLLTLLIAIPSAVKVFNWITTIWKGNIRFTAAMLFSIGFVSVFISGGLTGIWLGNSTLDIQLHDTYFVVAHFHLVMGVASVFGMYAGIYHWFPKMFGRFMNPFVGYIHFWITLLSAYLIFWPMYYEGLAGMPRRYFQFSGWTSFNQFGGLNEFISAIAILAFCAQVLFLINFFLSIFKGQPVAEKNPWKANTLEWTTPIHLSHGNWPGNIPDVFRGPYEYGKTGRDFQPQDEPPPQPATRHAVEPDQ